MSDRIVDSRRGFELRPGVATDADALVALSHRAIEHCYRPLLGDAPAARLIRDGHIEQSVREGIADCTVIAGSGRPRGYALCQDNLIRLLFVDPAWQLRGLGSRLLAAVESTLFARRARLWLESYCRNAPGTAFCARRGWRPVARYLDEALGTTRLVLEKDRAATAKRVGSTLAG